MTLVIILVAFACLSLGLISFLAVSRSLQRQGKKDAAALIRPIDVQAFRNLISPSEDDYLRRRLPAAQFRLVRRARLRAVAAYVHVASGNATVLVRMGEAALASGDPRVVEAAQQLVNHALLLRRNTALALLRIYVALAWPNSGFAAIRVAERYEQVSGTAMLLGRLQNPGVAVRLSSR